MMIRDSGLLFGPHCIWKNRDWKPEQKKKINFVINLHLKDCLEMEFIAC